MSENNLPEKIQEIVSDVEAKVADVAEQVASVADQVSEKAEDLSNKSLAELSDEFLKLKSGAESMSRSKEAEAIKSAFYKLLTKLKDEASVAGDSSISNPFDAVEQNFKAIYADYKAERAVFAKQQEEQREENLVKKQAIVEELKAIVEGQEDVSAQFPAFRQLQNRWREAGPVPEKSFRDLNDTYQFYVTKFYDMVKINRDLRDLDFRKNLEAKEAFCAAAEKLAENENVVSAFHELQKLHEQWKEYGPVAKERRDDIWNRFKAATAVINKKYQAHFESLKGQQEENLARKTELCEKIEAVVATECKSAADWNARTKEIEEIQEAWRKIGFATKKDNQKIYDRFRAACDAFFTAKRNYYNAFKGDLNENMTKKLALIEQAEALKDSTEWKKATDQFIALQKQWKEIGAVPRKKSDQLWKRFRAACDEYFAHRDAASPAGDNDYYANLKAKKRLIEEIVSYTPSDSETANAEQMRAFSEKWQGIGFVPFKEKEKVTADYTEAMQAKFPLFSKQRTAVGGRQRAVAPARSPKERLVAKYNALQQDITTYENNIGFFSASKNSEPLIRQMWEKVEQAKSELKELEAQIRAFDVAPSSEEDKQ